MNIIFRRTRVFGVLTILLLASSAISACDIKPAKSTRPLCIRAGEESPWAVWTSYHNYSEIVETLLHLNSTYPNIVDVYSIGKSWGNRDIYCVRLTNENHAHPKPKVLFVGYHHARELISAELPLYFAVDAVTSYGANATITRLLDYCEIYIVVALNADAFDVVQANEWARKNVHPFDEDADGLLDEDPPDDEDGDGYIEDLIFWNGTYYEFIRWEGIDSDADGLSNEDWIGGVDLNRNYGYQWDAPVESGSPYPEDEDYRGPAPFSEPETQAMRNLALLHNFRYGISFHSGTEIIGYPWGYTADPTVDDAIFRQIAGNLSALVGAPYGQASDMYTMSGTWDDWMYHNRSTFAFTCEIFKNDTAWQYEPGPDPDTFWEKGVLQFFNPDPKNIEGVIQRWLPVFTYIIERAISEAYDIALLREPATQWNQTHGGAHDDTGRSVVQTSDGGYVLAGSTYWSPSTGYDFWLVKTDSSGVMQWNQTYGGASSDYPRSVVQTSDGGYALTGVTSSFGTPGYNAWLVKTDSSGVMQWSQAYGGADPDVGRSVVQTIDGGYALAGYTLSFGAGKNDFWLVKTDSSGVMQWNQTYGGASDDYAHSVVQTSDGGYALTGQTLSFGAGGPDFWLVKTDSSGVMQWNQTYGGASSDYPRSVVQTGDGGYTLAGYTNSYGAGDHDSWLVKTDSAGALQWNQTYGAAGSDVAYSMVQTRDGGYALAGYTWSISTERYDYWLVKTDSTGTMQWNKTSRGADSVIAESVVQTSDGGYTLAGYIHYSATDTYDFWLIKLGPSPGVDPRIVQEGQNVNIIVAAKNEGTQAETFNVTAYYNTTIIETKTVTSLAPNTETTLVFDWNTTGVPHSNYNISIYVWPVLGETDLADNTHNRGTVLVTIPGDINGDKTVNSTDLSGLSEAYGSTPDSPNWNPDADINGDLVINVLDLTILGENFGKTI